MSRRIIIFLLWALAAVACVRELPEGGREIEPSPDEKVTIQFSVPQLPMTPATRALGETPELNTLHLAVFGSSGYLKEYVKAESCGKTGDKEFTYVDGSGVTHTELLPVYSFSITLTRSTKGRTIHFIGNGPETLDFGYEKDILPDLMSTQADGQAFWQIREGVKILDDNNDHKLDEDDGKFREVALIKNWAKIEIESEEGSNFDLISYAVVNVPSKGTVVPSYLNAEGERLFIRNYEEKSFRQLEKSAQEVDGGIAYPGSLPSDVTFDETVPTKEEFKSQYKEEGYQGKVAASGKAVYLYERPKPSNELPPTFVIVYGTFQDPDKPESEWKEYFYKIDLAEEGQYFPVFRNFKYLITIREILSRGHDTPEAAKAAAGSADISADVTTSHLTDISDGEARLIVQPWLSHSFIKRQVNNQVLSVKFFDNLMSGKPSMDNSAVTWESLDRDENNPVIESFSIGAPSTIYGADDGWRPITFTTGNPGMTTRSETIRIKGRYPKGELYRDIVITLTPLQQMTVKCGTPVVEKGLNEAQTVMISIPDGLIESMFPLVFTIEPEDMSLTPDNEVSDNNLPVMAGTSISDHARFRGKKTIQFQRTLTWDDYRHLDVEEDADGNSVRTFTCSFRTTRRENATTIWVANEFFIKSHDAFANPPAPKLNYFYVEALEDEGCEVKMKAKTLSYKVNDDLWQSNDELPTIGLKKGDRVYFSGNNLKNWNSADLFECTGGKFKVGGNIASLFLGITDGDISLDAGSDATSCDFKEFFKGETNLQDASELVLPMKSMRGSRFKSMFSGCVALEKAPALPAEILTDYCYELMFEGCSALTESPKLAARTLVTSCYASMFSGCSNLSEITMLALSSSGTNSLNNWVSGVAESGTFNQSGYIPGIPVNSVNGIPVGWTDVSWDEFYVEATEAGNVSCNGGNLWYSVDWEDWQPYTSGSAIPVAANGRVRFKGSSVSHVSAEVPFNVGGNIMSLVAGDNYASATTITTSGAFAGLFENETNLVSAALLNLPATTLAPSCYESMFAGCTGLTAAPALPATELKERCYQAMFQGCSSITSAPRLPAQKLVTNCYKMMFMDCGNLSYVVCAAEGNINGTDYTFEWMANVALAGTFIKDINAEWTTGINGIPEGWTVPQWRGFYVEAVDNVTVQINVSNLWYSTDALSWIEYTKNGKLSVAAGKRIWFKGTNTENIQNGDYTKFQCIGGRFRVGGNIMALRYDDNFETQGGTCDVQFTNMFKNHNGGVSGLGTLIDASKLVLPSTILKGKDTYKSMFDGCTYLTAGPAELPATTLCATCYRNMFKGCSSLVKAPDLLAVNLATGCYQNMFCDCTSLNEIKMMATTTYNEGYFYNSDPKWGDKGWVFGVASSGKFHYNANNTSISSWPRSAKGIPEGWDMVTP